MNGNLSQNCRLLSIRYKCRMIRLTDEQWKRIRDHFPEENIADGRPGRKPTPTRCVLKAVLWILNTGAQWHMLPQSYPNYKTVHRRFQTWCRDEVLRRVLTDVANELQARWTRKNASSTRPLLWPKVVGQKSAPPNAEKA